MLSPPPSVCVGPLPRLADVLTFDSPTATTGVTATCPPTAPILASVVISSTVLACRLRLFAPVSTPPSARPDDAPSVTRFSATAAPNPTPLLGVPTPTGSALAVELELVPATSVTSPPVSVTVPWIRASVVRFTISSARDPATDTFPPPAPAADSASNTCCVSLGTAVIVASASSDCALTVAPTGMSARLVSFTRLIATPAPTPTLVPPTDDPSAVACASVFSALFITTAPPALMLSGVANPACALVVTRSTPTAAATDTFPPLVCADGVTTVPTPLPPLLFACVSDCVFSVAVPESTPPAGAPAAPSAGAPPLVGLLPATSSELPIALKLTDPPALMALAVVALTVSFATVSASDTPNALVALDAVVPAVALTVVFAPAVCVADAFSDPPSVCVALLVPRFAVVVTSDTVTATTGVTATPPPVTPICASVVPRSLVVAVRLRLFAPVSTPPSATPADVLSVTRFSATDAPTPTFVLLVPVFASSAFAVVLVLVPATSVASPPVSVTVPSINASVVRFTISSARDPATDTFPPPAPAVDSASNTFCCPLVIVASASSDFAFTVAPTGTSAWLLASTRFTATPAPTPTPPPVTTDPSALAVALVPAWLTNVSDPPTWMLNGAANPATALLVTTFTATAAATDTFPPLVSTDGVGVVPVSLPPFPAAC